MDVFDTKKRSEIMSKVRSTNTKVERMVFSYLRKKNIYFQRHYRCVVGTPDIALPSRKIAVFIDGDFWHGRTYKEIAKRLPAYWKVKIARNIARDICNRSKLRRNGWAVLCVWESVLNNSKTREAKLKKIGDFLTNYQRKI